MSKEIIEGLEATKKEAEKGHYLGLSVAIVSIVTGVFFISYAGLLSTFFLPYVHDVPEMHIGWIFAGVGLFKIIGVVTNNTLIRRIAIVLLSFIWGGLAFVTFVYSFGAGFPDIIFIFTTKIASDCIRISVRGFATK